MLVAMYTLVHGKQESVMGLAFFILKKLVTFTGETGKTASNPDQGSMNTQMERSMSVFTPKTSE